MLRFSFFKASFSLNFSLLAFSPQWSAGRCRVLSLSPGIKVPALVPSSSSSASSGLYLSDTFRGFSPNFSRSLFVSSIEREITSLFPTLVSSSSSPSSLFSSSCLYRPRSLSSRPSFPSRRSRRSRDLKRTDYNRII